MGTSIAPPSDWKHKYSTNISPNVPWQTPWETEFDSTPPDSLQIPYDSGQQFHLTHIYNNAGCLASCNSFHITCITGATHTSSQPHQSKFDTNVVSIGIDNQCYITISHSKQDFVEPLKK